MTRRIGQPVISVVIPTVGRPSLAPCLTALAANSPGQAFEVVVSADGARAGIEAAVAPFRDGLALKLTVSVGSGPSTARNAGAAAATGEFVAFTDDDCEPQEGWLAALLDALRSAPGAAAGGEVRNGFPENRGAVASQLVVEALRARCNPPGGPPRFFPSSNIAFPRERFLEIGGFDEGFRYAEDRELCRRWLERGGRFVAAPGATVVHMRSFGTRDFLRQHYGYGRGAYAFGRGAQGSEDRGPGVLRELASRVRSEHEARPLSTAAYAAASQLATAAGYAREALLG